MKDAWQPENETLTNAGVKQLLDDIKTSGEVKIRAARHQKADFKDSDIVSLVTDNLLAFVKLKWIQGDDRMQVARVIPFQMIYEIDGNCGLSIRSMAGGRPEMLGNFADPMAAMDAADIDLIKRLFQLLNLARLG